MVVEEKYSGYWVQITAGLAVGALLFFIIYTSIGDILWKGIFRLVAFGFLAATVFSALKVMQGKHTIEIEIEDNNLVLSYSKKGRSVSRDIFELDNIGKLFSKQRSKYMVGAYLFNDFDLRFIPVDSDRPIKLIEVNGRTLALSKQDADKVLEFIEQHAPNAQMVDEQESGN